MSKKAHPPGQHGGGNKRRSKLSDFGKQLFEKQRLRLQFNIHERQMTNYVDKAARIKGNTGENLVQLLESRLDAFVCRAGLARTIYASRQYVMHGHIEVNGKPVDIPSYHLKPNDVVSVRQDSKKMECFQDAIRGSQPQPYIELRKASLEATLLYLPPREEIPVVCEVPLVVEFYSRK